MFHARLAAVSMTIEEVNDSYLGFLCTFVASFPYTLSSSLSLLEEGTMSRWFSSHNQWVWAFSCLALAPSFVNGQNDDQTASVNITNPASTTPVVSIEAVDFTSALHVAASVAPQLAQGNLSNPVPFPTDIPGYDRLSQLASAFPPIQKVSERPEDNTFEAVTRGNESSAEIQGRQSGLRVLVVGDSMTHCNEGDFTWRYRISQWFSSQSITVDFVGPYQGTWEAEEPVSRLELSTSKYCLTIHYVCLSVYALMLHGIGTSATTTALQGASPTGTSH